MQQHLLNHRYELIDQLGRGGMATVYRARDTRLGRPVAIKLLHAHYATDDEFRQRFEHEAQSAAGLSAHPNIVDVYDVGQQDNIPYIVMELVEGSDLKAIIEREGTLPIERVLSIAQQAAEGLEYAHSRGLVHRDVKPQNILVSPDGTARITDFGIAKSHLSTAVTQAGMTYGTADYISPEQAQGLPATPQSDIYSLGVVVYEMLTRHLPFAGDSPMTVALQHIQQPPPPLTQWNPTIPVSLERIVMSSLAKDPRQRPASARAFATALREYRTARAQETVAVPVAPRPAPRPAAPPQSAVGTTIPMPAVPRQAVSPPRVRRPVAPVPPPLTRAERRGGSGLAGLILGLLLLIGILGIAYVAFTTDTLAHLFAAAPTAVVVPTAAPLPTATTAPTGTPLVLVQVPNFLGKSEIDVVAQIGQLGFKRGVLDKPRNHTAPAGTVIGQAPPPGSKAPQGSEIKLLISLGPAVATVPNLVNQPFDAAQVALQAAGFKVVRRDQPSPTVPAGTIISQDPPPGDVNQGATVTLAVSQGDVVQFPPVIGSDRASAVAAIKTIDGLVLQLVDEQGPDRLPGYAKYRPNQVVSATANGKPVQNNQLVPRGSAIILGVRKP